MPSSPNRDDLAAEIVMAIGDDLLDPELGLDIHDGFLDGLPVKLLAQAPPPEDGQLIVYAVLFDGQVGARLSLSPGTPIHHISLPEDSHV